MSTSDLLGGGKSETITESIFREFYGLESFIEKSAIPSHYGFKSKKGTGYKGYPDFLGITRTRIL